MTWLQGRHLIPEPEPEKTPEPGRSENENQDVSEEGDIETIEINTPAGGQERRETRREGEISGEINTPPRQTTQATRPGDDMEISRPLDGSTTTEVTRRRSSGRSIPTDRYSEEFKLPEAPKSKRGARSSLKSLKAVLKESWAHRPEPTAPLRGRSKSRESSTEPTAPLRRRSKSRESSTSTKTRAASLERIQTGSIKNSSGIRNSTRTRYEVAGGGSYVQEADERSSQTVKEGINTISGQNSKIAKLQNSIILHPGQGAWVYLFEEPWQVSGNDLIFPNLAVHYC